MYSRAGVLTFLVLIISCVSFGEGDDSVGLLSKFEESLESSLTSYANSFVGWLEKFNDEHLGKGEIGKFLQYNEIKPRIGVTVKQSRNMKKMGLALLPLIFHVGATSTWMLVTALLAAKSVAIGMALLVFKIAVSSAKVASFFTTLKGKEHGWTPHYEHHGHYRSLSAEYHPTYEHTPYHEETYHEIPYSKSLDHKEKVTYLEHPSHEHKPTYIDFKPEEAETISGPWSPDTTHYSGKSISTFKRDVEPFYSKNKKGD